MNNLEKSSRRAFLGKFAAGTAAFTTLSGIGEEIFSKELSAIQNQCNEFPSVTSSDKKFVPVMITPYNSSLKIDFEALSKLIDFYLASGVKGFFANCLSSEMYHLSAEERLALTNHVVKRVQNTVPVVATGSFGESITERAEFSHKMYDTGVKAVILITSHFANKEENDTVLIQNLEKFFSLTGPIPMGTYECPSPYKRIITPEVLRYLLSTNRLVYHKDTTIDLEKVKAKLEICKNSTLEFYDAHTPNAMYSLQLDAKGISSIAGNFYPEIFVWMCNHINDQTRKADVQWLQSELTRADAIISQNYPLSSKYFLQKRGLPIETISRTGKSPLTVAQKQALDNVYSDLQGWHDRLGIQTVDKKFNK